MNKNSLIFLLLLIFTPPIWADDTLEAAATGNLVFEIAPEIIMQDETLIIHKSAGKDLSDDNFSIDVDFHFKNTSTHDVTRKVAFVFPPVQCRMDMNSLWGGLDLTQKEVAQNKGLLDFTTTVDGKPQAYTKRVEAMLGKQNITALLTKLGVPLNPCNIQTTSDGGADPRYGSLLKPYHLLTEANEAAWSENIYFEWTQTFPAGKVINIHHHYTPVIGESVLSPRTIDELNQTFTATNPPQFPVWNRNPQTLSQTNPNLVSTKNALGTDATKKSYCVMPKWVEYHLTTGANWNHGIGVFNLIITDDGNQPFAVNQFYNDQNGAVISMQGNTLSFTIKNFIPEKNLFVLFLSLPTTPQEMQSCGM